MIGTVLGNYKIEKELGTGGMGTVYLGLHTSIGSKVAIKVLHSHLIKNDEINTRFLKEAKTQAILDHPNITKVIDYIDDGDNLFIILEFVEGIALNDYLFKTKGLLPEKEANHYMCKILDAVGYAHSKGVIHRDIKSANIMITPDRSIKIMDFGIAKLSGETLSLTKTGSRMGSPLYMSPEQVTGGAVDFRSDIYSLGVLYHEMLTGKPVYDQTTSTEFEIYNNIVKQPLPRLDTLYKMISPKAQEIVDNATSKFPAGRYANCEEFKQAILGKEDDFAIIPKNPGKPSVSAKTKKKSNVGVWAVVLGFVAVLGGGGFLLWKNPNILNAKVPVELKNARQFESRGDLKSALVVYQKITNPTDEVVAEIERLKNDSEKFKNQQLTAIYNAKLNGADLENFPVEDTTALQTILKNYEVLKADLKKLYSNKKIADTTGLTVMITDVEILKNVALSERLLKENQIDSLNNFLTTIEAQKNNRYFSNVLNKLDAENNKAPDAIPFDFADVPPRYPDCNFRTKKSNAACFDRKIQQHILRNHNKNLYNSLGLSAGNHTIYYLFSIDEKGKLSNIKIRASHPTIEQDVKTILQTLPQFDPGKQHGKVTAVTFNSSVTLKLGKNELKENPNIPQAETPLADEMVEITNTSPKTVGIVMADIAPVFPGCDGEYGSGLRKCTSNKIDTFIIERINNINFKRDEVSEGEILIKTRFTITTAGHISNINVDTENTVVQASVVNIIKKIPTLKPGFVDGNLANIIYNLTFTFNAKF